MLHAFEYLPYNMATGRKVHRMQAHQKNTQKRATEKPEEEKRTFWVQTKTRE